MAGFASHAPAPPHPHPEQGLPAHSGGSLCLENMLEDSEMFLESQALGAHGGLGTPLPLPPSPRLTGLPSVPHACLVCPKPGPLSGPCVLLQAVPSALCTAAPAHLPGLRQVSCPQRAPDHQVPCGLNTLGRPGNLGVLVLCTPTKWDSQACTRAQGTG